MLFDSSRNVTALLFFLLPSTTSPGLTWLSFLKRPILLWKWTALLPLTIIPPPATPRRDQEHISSYQAPFITPALLRMRCLSRRSMTWVCISSLPLFIHTLGTFVLDRPHISHIHLMFYPPAMFMYVCTDGNTNVVAMSCAVES
ncbi:hypothetical protein C8R44DRAFT_774881, partial [Mycena epipterygia]